VTDTWDSATGYLTADKAFELLTKWL
jgi:hypothetical protein